MIFFLLNEVAVVMDLLWVSSLGLLWRLVRSLWGEGGDNKESFGFFLSLSLF